MLQKFSYLLNTVINLKFSQLIWQLIYRIKPNFYLEKKVLETDYYPNISFIIYPKMEGKFNKKNEFEFLNLKKSFANEINWDFADFGKLWTYNLEYFDFISQDNLDIEEKEGLIYDFYNFSTDKCRKLEPYPVSLRSINLLKFYIYNKVENKIVFGYLHQELNYLSKNCEYHILGNHLLENAFALALGGAFFNENKWLRKGEKLILSQLKEQIMSDGAHFELSPMYHKIILFRVLEFIDWYNDFNENNPEILSFCKTIARKMLSWLNLMTYKNGSVANFNDSAEGITFGTKFLMDYSRKLDINFRLIPLDDSGYRSFFNDKYEIKIDFAQISSSYQPGHGHADALSFILHSDEEPVFVEQGTSTYQIGDRRNLERSTEAHNTVVVNNTNQSEVWGGFRVGKQAHTTILNQENNIFEARHDGYSNQGVLHNRKYVCLKNQIRIIDNLSSPSKASFYLHIHPNFRITRINEIVYSISDKILVQFEDDDLVVVEEYSYAECYNKYMTAQRFKVNFSNRLLTTINFIN